MPTLLPEHRANLAKLATYLESLPRDYCEHFFHMASFATLPLFNGTATASVCPPPENLIPDTDHTGYKCGAVACAVGHGPAAGIPPLLGESWMGYCLRAFGTSTAGRNDTAWEWLFSSTWEMTDSTAKGAAARIRYFLDHGVPADYKYMQSSDPDYDNDPEIYEQYQDLIRPYVKLVNS